MFQPIFGKLNLSPVLFFIFLFGVLRYMVFDIISDNDLTILKCVIFG